MREFNITGSCDPKYHYMVDLTSRLEQIKIMIDKGKYFCINRGRQFGKTTTLDALSEFLKNEYCVIHLDFQSVTGRDFSSEENFVRAFARELIYRTNVLQDMPEDSISEFKKIYDNKFYGLSDLFIITEHWCESSNKPIVLIIDEVDQASNNQIFLDFLAQLRLNYLNRNKISTFQSVILAGVHDIRNLKQKIRPDAEHKHNSPWNIASPFEVEMSFSIEDIEGMLEQYLSEHTEVIMDKHAISQNIYDYTSGYPVLVSTLCKYMDEEYSFTDDGFLSSVNKLLKSENPLFDSLVNKLEDYNELRDVLSRILILGETISYSPDNTNMRLAKMYGFIKDNNGIVKIANRIFETRLYNAMLMTVEMQSTHAYRSGSMYKNLFIQNNNLNMELILKKFAETYHDVYGSMPEEKLEEECRKLFLLYLRPIINGSGNYYIEARTRDLCRTDIIIDFGGKQYIIEMKVWRGKAYLEAGEDQLVDYLESYHNGKGYLLTFDFRKKKKTGIETKIIQGKIIFEVTV